MQKFKNQSNSRIDDQDANKGLRNILGALETWLKGALYMFICYLHVCYLLTYLLRVSKWSSWTHKQCWPTWQAANLQTNYNVSTKYSANTSKLNTCTLEPETQHHEKTSIM